MRNWIISLKIFLFFTLITGLVYPLLITGIGQVVFPNNANGSLLKKDNQYIGSSLIGQQFDSSIYFMSRPSAIAYNPLPSGASNYGLTNSKLKKFVDDQRHHFVMVNGLDSTQEVPSEMLFASGSGLDPHISPTAAYLQVDRIVRVRNLSSDQKQKLIVLIKDLTEPPQLLFLGEDRINVLLLNLKLDALK